MKLTESLFARSTWSSARPGTVAYDILRRLVELSGPNRDWVSAAQLAKEFPAYAENFYISQRNYEPPPFFEFVETKATYQNKDISLDDEIQLRKSGVPGAYIHRFFRPLPGLAQALAQRPAVSRPVRIKEPFQIGLPKKEREDRIPPEYFLHPAIGTDAFEVLSYIDSKGSVNSSDLKKKFTDLYNQQKDVFSATGPLARSGAVDVQKVGVELIFSLSLRGKALLAKAPTLKAYPLTFAQKPRKAAIRGEIAGLFERLKSLKQKVATFDRQSPKTEIELDPLRGQKF